MRDIPRIVLRRRGGQRRAVDAQQARVARRHHHHLLTPLPRMRRDQRALLPDRKVGRVLAHGDRRAREMRGHAVARAVDTHERIIGHDTLAHMREGIHESLSCPGFPFALSSLGECSVPVKRSPSATLEREVIVSVMVLYLLITLTMLVIHYAQPSGTKTQSSSPSPSHAPGT